VSNRHAEVSFHDGTFYLMDVSANGVFVNGAAEALGRGQRVRLRHGDRLTMGDYELAVELETAAAPRPAPDPLPGPSQAPLIPDDFDLSLRGQSKDPFGRSASPTSLLDNADPVDPLALLPGQPASRRTPPPGAMEDHLPSEQGPFRPPRAVPEQGSQAIPDDWDATGSLRAPARPAAPTPTGPRISTLPENWIDDEPPASSPPSSPIRSAPPQPGREPRAVPSGGSSDALLRIFVEELGLPEGKAVGRGADELVRDVAVVLRELVAGIMGLLASRSAFKSQFRIEGTVIRPAENNPLKFAADARQALEHLFFPSGKAYLPAERAVREAVQNLVDHKVALLAALRGALESLVARFDPDQLEARFGERGKSSLMGLSGKGRQWEMYRELFAELRRDPDALFGDILGEDFAKTYEEQLERLVRSRR
jgi:type VI secretion system FHA domain protein